MKPFMDLLGNVGRLMRVSKQGNALGFPYGKAAGVDFNATTGVPINGTPNWLPGAMFINSKGSSGTCFYLNTGTNLLSVWTNVDAAILASVGGNGIVGVAAGYKLARGVTALDGSNPTPVATGLTTVVAATVTLEGSVAPGVGTSVLTIASTNYATGALAVYAWKPTSNADPTLIASTGTENFEWIAVGT